MTSHARSVPLPRGPTATVAGEVPATCQGSNGVICFAAVDWWYHNRAHSDFQLMRNIAADRPVLLVNSIGMRLPLPGRSPQAARRVLRKARSMLKLVRRPDASQPCFHVMTPFLLPAYGSPLGRWLNSRLVAAQVRLVSQALGLRRPDVVVTLPTALPAALLLPHRKLLFNRSDKHSAFPEVDRAVVERLESELLARADHVLYVSHELMEEDAPLAGDRAHFLDHGVDVAHFVQTPAAREPDDVAALPRPRLGFFGGFDDYVIDFDLLEKLATEMPEAHLLLIGDATCSMQRLTRHANVTWLGARPYAEIPAYGRSFDVALMPWLQSEWIRYCNPIKLKEYLLLGLPVVSTAFPAVARFQDRVAVASDAEDFVRLVRVALLETQRRPVPDGADAWSWGARADELLALTDSALRPALV